MRPQRTLTALCCIALSWLTIAPLRAAPEKATRERPNIVIILADDLGWRDLRCYGSPWHDTPNLDRLVKQGMRFTQGYAPAPICSASRASMLTGLSPARLGFEFVTKEPTAPAPMEHPLKSPPYPLNLPVERITLAEAIGPAGYATAYFGKWHVSQHNQFYLGWSNTHGPLQQGYAEGSHAFGSHPYGDKDRTAEENKAELREGDYGPDALTQKAVGYLRARRGERFYMHLAHYYVHSPVRTRARWLERKYAARLPSDAGAARAAYGAMVETLDHLVGEVLDELDRLGIADRTLVVFTSDNGGNPEFAANGPLRGSKWNLYEGGLRVPWIVRWPGVVKAGATSDAPIWGADLMPTLCEVAGAKVPEGVPLDGRSLVPLLRSANPAPSANEARGDAVAATGAESALSGRPLVWHFPYYHPEPAKAFTRALDRVGVNDFAISKSYPQSAIRRGDYKLIHFHEDNRDELYRLTSDVSESDDLVAREPAVAAELRRDLDAYLARVGARMPVARSGVPRTGGQ